MREYIWLYIFRYSYTNTHTYIYTHNYIHTYLYIKGIYQIGLPHVVWIVKLWLFNNRKADNLVVLQSTKLDVYSDRLLNVES